MRNTTSAGGVNGLGSGVRNVPENALRFWGKFTGKKMSARQKVRPLLEIREHLHQALRTLAGREEPLAVTISVNLFRKDPALRQKNQTLIRNAIRQFEEKARARTDLFSIEWIQQTRENLENLQEEIPYLSPPESVVLVASPREGSWFPLPFRVQEKVVVDRTYEIRDILFAVNRWVPYFAILFASDSDIIPYTGIGEELYELEELHAYLRGLRVEPEVEKATAGIQAGDESVLRQRLQAGYMHRALEWSLRQMDLKDTPLVLVANPKELGIARKILDELGVEPQQVLTLEKDLRDLREFSVRQEIWAKVQEWIVQHRTRLLERVERYFKIRRVAVGEHDPVILARTGAVETLLLEENYSFSAWSHREHPLKLRQDPPPPEEKDQWLYHEDMVDDVIETVLSFRGHVFFFPAGILQEKYQTRLIALLRYVP